jgi:hypothetical protein
MVCPEHAPAGGVRAAELPKGFGAGLNSRGAETRWNWHPPCGVFPLSGVKHPDGEAGPWHQPIPGVRSASSPAPNSVNAQPIVKTPS